MKTKDNRNFYCSLPKSKLQDLCKKHGLSPYNTKPNLVSSLVTYVKGEDDLLSKEMNTKDSENSICRLPKKDLQDLCRKHGLSPYNSKPNLVYSLITYVKGAERFSFTEMKTKDSGNSITSLPKQKLQDLCRKYGLSPYKTKPDLVTSLITYFKKADVGTSEGNDYDVQDSSGLRSLIDEKRIKQRVHCPEISFAKKTRTSDITSMHAPSFEFSVSSEDGINLYVDLNSCQSDWFKRFRKEGCVCHNLQNKKFQSFRQELQYLGNKRQMTSSFLWKTDSSNRFYSGHAEPISCPSLCGTIDVVHQTENTDDVSFGYSATTKSLNGSVENFTRSDRKKGSPPLSGTVCGVHNVNISDVDTFMGEEEIKYVDMNTFEASEKTLSINGTVCPVADNAENTSEALDTRLCKSFHASLEKVAISSPEDAPELKQNKNENQNTRLCNVSCINSECQSTCTPKKLSVLAHLSTETDFTEIEASDICSHHQYASYSSSEKDCFRNLVDAAESLRSQLPNSCEDSCSIFLDDTPSSADGGARDSHVNGTEASKEHLKKLQEHFPHGEKMKKRHESKSDNVQHCNEGRILRSAKRLQILPRRSLRLVSQ